MASREIEALTGALAKLPGLGPRSARRAVLHLLKRRESALAPLLDALDTCDGRLGLVVVTGAMGVGAALIVERIDRS